MFEPTQFSRLSSNIVQQIRQAILKEHLKPGDRLPPEKEVAQRFKVSKASLREAYRALEALGLIEVRQGVSGGAFVCAVDLEVFREGLINYIFFQQPTLEEFTQFRLMLEPQLAKMAAEKISSESFTLLEENLQISQNMVWEGKYSYEFDLVFHKLVARTAENTFLSIMIDSVHNALISLKKSYEPDMDFCRQVHEAHEKIFQAIKSKNSKQAEQEMETHLQEVHSGLKRIMKEG